MVVAIIIFVLVVACAFLFSNKESKNEPANQPAEQEENPSVTEHVPDKEAIPTPPPEPEAAETAESEASLENESSSQEDFPEPPVNAIPEEQYQNKLKIPVTGVALGGRYLRFKQVIMDLNEKGFFAPLYDGLSDEAIKERELRTWEFNFDTPLPFAAIDTEVSKQGSIKVYISDSVTACYHVGYIPEEHTQTVLNIIHHKKPYKVKAYLKGGKYKDIDHSINGRDRIVTREARYGLEVELLYNE